MKTIIIIIILVASVNLSFSQNGWFYQNSGVTSRISDIFFIDSQTGWAITDSTRVLKTTDGGNNWTSQTLSGYTPLGCIYFINANTGWTGGGYYFFAQSGTIYKTTNGGNSWFVLNHIGNVQDLYFSNATNGVAGLDQSGDFGTGGSIIQTSNGGTNWNGNYTNYNIPSIAFINSNSGYALGHYWDDTGHDSSIVYGTADGGITWDVRYRKSNFPFFYYNDLKRIFALGSDVWMAGRDSFIVHSSNSGLSWDNQIIPDHKTKDAVFFIDNNIGWAVGNNSADTSNIIKTTNGGATWFNVRNSHSNALRTVFFADQYVGWAAGDDGIILKTVTGGLTSVTGQTSVFNSDYRLHQNFPNPFNPSTKIFYDIKSTGQVKLKVYDIYGREVKTLVDKNLGPGNYETVFDAGSLASGVYIYKLEVNGVQIDSKKMALIR